MMNEVVGQPEVGIVIPLYNKGVGIQRAIASVLSQSFPHFRLIIVDDGSTDDSLALARECTDPRVVIVTQNNAGPAAARNRGAALCGTPLIAFLDADDEWAPDFLAKGCEALARHPECGAFACGYDAGEFASVRPNKVRLQGLNGKHRPPTDIAGPNLKMYIDALHSSCVIVRRTVFEALGGYYNKTRVLYGEDSFLWLKLALSHDIFWTQEELTIFHVEDSALGFALKTQRLPRPISSDSESLQPFCLAEYQPALQRIIREFVEADIKGLSRSGAFDEASRLRRLHGIAPISGTVVDHLRYWKRRLSRMAV